MELSGQIIKTKALELGFSYCGFAKAKQLEQDRDFFTSYLNENRNAGLHYLERNPDIRTDPQLLIKGTQTVIGLLLNYYPAEILPEEDNFIISKYAYGKDYHKVLKERSQALIRFICGENKDVKAKAFVDSGPVLEKAWGRYCGLGWTGKNTLLINPERGSFHFIAIILTNLKLEPDLPEGDHCGTCHRCMDSCPTGALEVPYVLNPSKCIAYLTIHGKENIPEEFANNLHNRIYGCDICQDVCPYNQFAEMHTLPEFLPPERLKMMRKKDWLQLSSEEFNYLFKESAIYRIGYEKLLNNIQDAAKSHSE